MKRAEGRREQDGPRVDRGPMIQRMMRLLLTLAMLAGAALSPGTAQGESVPSARADVIAVYLFWSASCPHCVKAKAFLEALAAGDPAVELRTFELGSDTADRAFAALNEHYQIEPPAVPLVAIGNKIFVGFSSDATSGREMREAVAACHRESCGDVAGVIVREAATPSAQGLHQARPGAVERPPQPETVWLPLLGEVETRTLSLPALTVVLGLVDGFNPCAMWVLVFLIGLLVGINDPIRMWSFGAVFLLTSAVVYLAALAAWLNVLLVLGSLVFIRVGIGVFAIAAGVYYLWQFWINPGATCPVTSPVERQRVMTRLKEAVGQQSFLAAIAGIVVLAALVNLIELLCSAGVPAIYTQVLAMSDLSTPAYAGYLLLYITVFLVDDIVVFVTAMLTLRATGLAATYSRYSHLLGGIVLGAIGLLLLFRPQWLVLT
jgi:glutaredoxin